MKKFRTEKSDFEWVESGDQKQAILQYDNLDTNVNFDLNFINLNSIKHLQSSQLMLRRNLFNSGIIILFAFLLMLQSSKGDTLTVLFLGNSHTFYNNLPQKVAHIANSLGDTLIFESSTPGGCTLGHPSNGHLYNSVSLALIDSLDWDYVILQEHSLFAVIEYYKETYMYPGAKSIDSLVKLNNECTETLLQVIWGKKYGGVHCINLNCTIDFEDFSHMQDSLTAEYSRLGDTLSCTLAPSGPAWKHSIQTGDTIELFDPDESHPSWAGTYLSACVYYAVLYQKSPIGSSYYGQLEPEQALSLQEIADEVVFSNPELWNINGNKPIAGFEFVQIDNSVIFTDTSMNADYFIWDFGDGTTDTTQNPTHVYQSSGTYYVTHEVGDACDSDIAIDTVEIYISNVTEIDDFNKDIHVFKGNDKGEYEIRSQKYLINRIRLYASDGSLSVSKELLGKSEYNLQIDNLPNGIYILVVEHSAGINSFKVLNF